MSELIIKGQKAKEASYILMNATTTEKNNALLKMAEILLKSSKERYQVPVICMIIWKKTGIVWNMK